MKDENCQDESLNDEAITLQQLRSAVERFVREREWEQYHSPQELAASISIEAAELLEVFQWKLRKEMDSGQRDKVREELADIIIYSLELANVLGEDVSKLVMEKLELNAKKYPVEKCKGKSDKYTNL